MGFGPDGEGTIIGKDGEHMLKRENKPLYLGTILCKYCNDIIDIVDTDNVIIFYSACDRQECRNNDKRKGVTIDEG